MKICSVDVVIDLLFSGCFHYQNTPSDKKRVPLETKCSIKTIERKKQFHLTYINTKTSNMLSSLLLADLSQPLEHGGQQLLHFCTSALPVCGKTHSLEYEPEI